MDPLPHNYDPTHAAKRMLSQVSGMFMVPFPSKDLHRTHKPGAPGKPGYKPGQGKVRRSSQGRTRRQGGDSLA